ncbi:helix-turn-helix transcriptional regulator [Providencia rettgeri]|nr:helix-turn-helix transcriptional regulator [Providencia rettgeri]
MEVNNLSYYAGVFLRKSRKEKNLTGKQLAKLMHVSQQQISRYETGKTSLTIDQLSQLLNILDNKLGWTNNVCSKWTWLWYKNG